MYVEPIFLFFVLLWLWGSSRETEKRLKVLESPPSPPVTPSPAERFARAKDTIAWLEAEGKDAAWLRATWGKELMAEARTQGRFPISPAALALQCRPTPKVD